MARGISNQTGGSQPAKVNVFTSGTNENMSLGNPLGTTRRQRIFFKPHANFLTEKVVLGSATTIFIGSNPGCGFYVAGKFDDEHFMTPRFFEVDGEVVGAAVGASHAIVCCKRHFYAIGDNANNQLGAGPFVARLARLSRLELPLLSSQDEIIDCVTSARHTVIATRKDLYVSGTNYGQMGEYAARAFYTKFTQPKGFFRMLRAEDPFLKYGGVSVALSDNMTVLYGGNRARIFFEYHEYSASFINPDNNYTCQLVSATVCKIPSLGTGVLFFSAIDWSVYLWRRHASGKFVTPIWSGSSNMTAKRVRRRADASRFSAAQNGEFFICSPFDVLKGKISLRSDGNVEVQVHQVTSLPGSILRVFFSPDAKNLAFISLANAPPAKSAPCVEARRRAGFFAARYAPLNELRAQYEPTNCEWRNCEEFDAELRAQSAELATVVVESKSRRFRVHRYILAARFARLLTPKWLKRKPDDKDDDTANVVDLRRVSDDAVEQLIEFIYTGTCRTFLIAEGCATKHMLGIVSANVCDICGQREPTLEFPQTTLRSPSPSVDSDFGSENSDTWPTSTDDETFLEQSIGAIDNSQARRNGQKGLLSIRESSTRQIPHTEPGCSLMASDERPADVDEQLNSCLIRLGELGRDLRWPELQICVTIAKEAISERFLDVQVSTSFQIGVDLINGDEIFSVDEGDLLVTLEYENGKKMRFSRQLLRESAYFETLFRWHNDLLELSVESISPELLAVALRFLITRNLDGVSLTYQELMELLRFADYYSFLALADEAVHWLEFELHMDNVEEFFALAGTICLPSLDAAISAFVRRNTRLFCACSTRVALLDALPIGSGLRNELVDCVKPKTSLTGVTNDLSKLVDKVDYQANGNERIKIENEGESFRGVIDTEEKQDQRNHVDQSQLRPENVESEPGSEMSSVERIDSPANLFSHDGVLPANQLALNQSDAISMSRDEVNENQSQLKPLFESKQAASSWRNLNANGIIPVPIAVQFAEAASREDSEFAPSLATKKNWRKHRKTQKMRKEPSRRSEPVDVYAMRCMSGDATPASASTTSTPNSSLAAWSGTSSAPGSSISKTSLREIMRQEEEALQKQNAKPFVSRTVQADASAIVVGSPSSGWTINAQSSAASSNVAGAEGTAGNSNTAAEPPIASVVSLRRIQAEECAVQERRAHAAWCRATKTLQRVEVEERALREFEEYYETIYAAQGDLPAFFVVKRDEMNDELNTATPIQRAMSCRYGNAGLNDKVINGVADDLNSLNFLVPKTSEKHCNDSNITGIRPNVPTAKSPNVTYNRSQDRRSPGGVTRESASRNYSHGILGTSPTSSATTTSTRPSAWRQKPRV